MASFSDSRYELCKKYIRKRHERGIDWALIRYITSNQIHATQSHLIDELDDKVNDDWPRMTVDEWFALFDEERGIIERYESEVDGGLVVVTNRNHSEIDFNSIYDDPSSCWNRYKFKLLHRAMFHENAVMMLQSECERVVSHLKDRTGAGAPVKGLVVGNVQSGKTANMAGVIAMAADLGYNFFIVLSGLITNLKDQTADRLYSDLALLDGEVDSNMRLQWNVLRNLQPRCSLDQRLVAMHLSEQENGVPNRARYLNVCLKNIKRLRDLLGWLQSQDSVDKTGQLKILIIDDECDQAGVNTGDLEKGEQTRIFQLIKGLCDHAAPAAKDTVKAGVPYKTVNYIAYSATPYANILNDGNSDTSLYPRDFICSLPMSPSYWGASRYFASQSPDLENVFSGFPFIRQITGEDLTTISSIHKGTSNDAPGSLKDAVDWFLCIGSVRRFMGVNKPVSMLVHTSNKTCDHSAIARVIEKYLTELRSELKTSQEQLMVRLKHAYDGERNKISAEDLLEMFPDYEASQGNPVRDLPNFEDFKDVLIELLGQNVNHIKTAEEDGSLEYKYGKGVHLCVDNSCNNALIADEDGTSYTMRIKYPRGGAANVVSPLFMVVGGNTLSRGLTLEGLVCSYFVRTVRQSDSLMQMGRWFGYRFGYELAPRVWMSEGTLAKFCLLNQVEMDLRKSLREAMEIGLPPEEMIPCIIDTSSAIRNFTITSPKKMQMAIRAEEDFSGLQKVLSTYEDTANALQLNCSAALEMLAEIGSFEKSPEYAKSNYFNSSVEWGTVKRFLEKTHISERGKDRGRKDLILDYVNRSLVDKKWIVVVSGNSCVGDQEIWGFGDGYKIGTVGRSAKQKDGALIFQHVTQPQDFVCDIAHDLDCDQDVERFSARTGSSCVRYYRSHATKRGRDRQPMLIVNRISAKYLREHGCANVSDDILGIAFYFPGTTDRTIGSYTKLRVGNLQPDVESESEI